MNETTKTVVTTIINGGTTTVTTEHYRYARDWELVVTERDTTTRESSYPFERFEQLAVAPV